MSRRGLKRAVKLKSGACVASSSLLAVMLANPAAAQSANGPGSGPSVTSEAARANPQASGPINNTGAVPPADQQSAPAAAPAPDGSAGTDIVVTGSRIASLANNSPTPLTVVTKEQLTQTTPRDLPDGLNKLPIFQGSQQPRRPGPGGSNEGSNQLALRNFGAQRTLVLLDGHRLTPANANGTVDADTIPQMLVSRVDVVTGGASAVYGSDAVTGVVNFILDTKFTGFKVDANAGVSTYGDAPRYKVGVAAGLDVGERGHLIASYEHLRSR